MTDEVSRGAESRNPTGQRRDAQNSMDRRGQRGRRIETDPVTPPPASAPVSEPAIKVSLGEQVEVSTTAIYTRQKRLATVGQGTPDPSLGTVNPSPGSEKPELP